MALIAGIHKVNSPKRKSKMTKQQAAQLPELVEDGSVAIDMEKAGLPSNIGVENAILGEIFHRPKTFAHVASVLSPRDFMLEVNREIYEAMVGVDQAGAPISVHTVVDKLSQMGQRRPDSISYITDLGGTLTGSATDGTLSSWCAILREKAILRDIVSAGQAAINAALLGQRKSTDILAELDSSVREGYEETRQRRGAESIADIIIAKGGMDVFFSSDVTGCVSSAWKSLHAITSWFRPGHLILIAGRPAQGKSVIGLNMAAYMAKRFGYTAFHSLEMDQQQLINRLISAKTKINYSVVEDGEAAWTDEQRRKITAAASELSELDLAIIEDEAATVMGLRSWFLRQKRKPVALFIDYIQLMVGDHSRQRNEEISEISRSLKRLAKELGVPIICLCQLGRAVESAEGGIPELHHLAESGSLERDADKVIMLHRPEFYTKAGRAAADGDPVTGRLDAYVRKNRQGPTGRAKLMFEPEYCRISERKIIAAGTEQAVAIPDEGAVGPGGPLEVLAVQGRLIDEVAA